MDRSLEGCIALTVARAPARDLRAALAAAGSVALVLGVLVYMADRAHAPVAAMPAFALLATGPLFGALGQWLPSFAHPFAFSLFTAAARPAGAPPAYAACAAWWSVNVAFELGQHAAVRTRVAEALRATLGEGGFAQALSNYFIHGTFDAGDVVAATLGAAAAAGAIRCIHRWEGRHAPQR